MPEADPFENEYTRIISNSNTASCEAHGVYYVWAKWPKAALSFANAVYDVFFFSLHLMLSLSLKQICLTEHISISNVFCIKTSLCLNFFRLKIGYSSLHIRIKGRIASELFAMNSRFDLGQLYFLY